MHQTEPEPNTLNSFTDGMDIEFNNIGFVLSSGIEIMKGVTGKFASRRMCAIMGYVIHILYILL